METAFPGSSLHDHVISRARREQFFVRRPRARPEITPPFYQLSGKWARTDRTPLVPLMLVKSWG